LTLSPRVLEMGHIVVIIRDPADDWFGRGVTGAPSRFTWNRDDKRVVCAVQGFVVSFSIFRD
jgi:hypothetical protein